MVSQAFTTQTEMEEEDRACTPNRSDLNQQHNNALTGCVIVATQKFNVHISQSAEVPPTEQGPRDADMAITPPPDHPRYQWFCGSWVYIQCVPRSWPCIARLRQAPQGTGSLMTILPRLLQALHLTLQT